MTNKEKVLAVHPNAVVEMRQTTGGAKYYLVRSQPGSYMPIGDGKSKPAAWADAARRLARLSA